MHLVDDGATHIPAEGSIGAAVAGLCPTPTPSSTASQRPGAVTGYTRKPGFMAVKPEVVCMCTYIYIYI